MSKDGEIFGEGQPVDCLYKVVDGAVRTFKVLTTDAGRSADFTFQESFSASKLSDEHAHSAEAITNSKILIIKRSVLAALAKHDLEIAHRLMRLDCLRAQARANARHHADQDGHERVVEFLLEMTRVNQWTVGSICRCRGWTSRTILD